MMKNGVESNVEKSGETEEPQRQTIRRKYRKYGLKKNEKNIKEGKYTGIIKNLMEPGDENKNGMMKTKVKDDGGEDGETGAPQW